MLKREDALSLVLMYSGLAYFHAEAYTVVIDDGDRGVFFEVFAQFGDEDVEAAAEEVVVFAPEFGEDFAALGNLVLVQGEEAEEVCFFLGELALVVAEVETEVAVVKGVATKLEDIACDLLLALGLAPAQEDVDAEKELFYIEGFGDVVVGSCFEAFDFVFLHGLGSEEEDGGEVVCFSDFAGETDAVGFGEHDVEDAEVKVVFAECFIACLTVFAVGDVVARDFQIVAGDEGQVGVVFYE